jgi:hypothetical protein
MGIRNGNGDLLKWVANLAKVVWYVGVIAGATWYVSKWDTRMTDLERGVARLENQMAQLRTDTIQRSEYERVKRMADREHRRIWTAIGRKEDAEDLGQ